MNRDATPTGFEYAFELAHWAMIGVDAEGTVRLFNRAAERITGFSREEVIDRPLSGLLDGCDMPSTKFEAFMGRQPAASQAEFLCSIRPRAGRRRDIAWKLARLPENANASIEVFAFGSDAELEKTGAVMSMCENLAHEIRNPLNGALLYATILERALEANAVGGDCVHALAVIKAELRRLASALTELLELNAKGHE